MSSNIRLLQLHSRLERLKSTQNTQSLDSLYSAKHDLLPLSPKLSLVTEEHPQLPHPKQPQLSFSPHIKAAIGSIKTNTLAFSAAAVLLIGIFTFNTTLSPRSTPIPAQAAQSIQSSKSATSSNRQNLTELEELYHVMAEKNGYGEVLFPQLDLTQKNSLKIETKSIQIGDNKDIAHVQYSVLPGVKGHSIFVSSKEEVARTLTSLVPGTRVSLQEGEGDQVTLYKYIYIANNQYPEGDANVLTPSQKSILNIIVLDKEGVYNSFQFRLISVDS